MAESELALKEACILAEEIHFKELLERFDAQPDIIISEGQYDRIYKLIFDQATNNSKEKKEKHISSKKIKVIILAVAVLVILLSVSAMAYNPLRDFFVKIYKDCTEIVFYITNNNDYLFAEYTYIPEGYNKIKDDRVKAANFQLILYRKDKSDIKISTMENKHSSTFIDTENTEAGEVMINESIGYYSITKTGIILVWSTGKYNHCLTAALKNNITLKEVVKIAQSRRPVK